MAENWLSVTREDCIKLAWWRPRRLSAVPILVQMQILQDLDAGMTMQRTADTYHVGLRYVAYLAKRRAPFTARFDLPEGFEFLSTPQRPLIEKLRKTHSP